MKKFTIKNLKDIPIEHAHGESGKKQVLATSDLVTSSYFEAWTKGYLELGSVFDWHTHKDTDEIFLVLKGNGIFYWENEIANYEEGDIITIPSNTKHKIKAQGSETNEFYFIRVKTL